MNIHYLTQDIETYDESYTAFGEQCRLAYNMYAPPISKTCAGIVFRQSELSGLSENNFSYGDLYI